MSKAFTKEDDQGGTAVLRSGSFVVPSYPFRITATGAATLSLSSDERLRDALPRAEVLPPTPHRPSIATLGVTVRTRMADGEPRAYRLVTAEERALTGDGCSLQSPVGRALLGATVGDVREVQTPRGLEELEVVELEGESS